MAKEAPEVTLSFREDPGPFWANLTGASNTQDDASEKTSEKIPQLLSDNMGLTIAELAKLCNISTRSIERNLKKLQTDGRIRRVGPDKGGHWEVVRAKK